MYDITSAQMLAAPNVSVLAVVDSGHLLLLPPVIGPLLGEPVVNDLVPSSPALAIDFPAPSEGIAWSVASAFEVGDQTLGSRVLAVQVVAGPVVRVLVSRDPQRGFRA